MLYPIELTGLIAIYALAKQIIAYFKVFWFLSGEVIPSDRRCSV